jgi:hypothetical protein
MTEELLGGPFILLFFAVFFVECFFAALLGATSCSTVKRGFQPKHRKDKIGSSCEFSDLFYYPSLCFLFLGAERKMMADGSSRLPKKQTKQNNKTSKQQANNKQTTSSKQQPC